MTLAPLPPGGTIGMLGGGQLGRMLAMAAADMGLRVCVLCPDPASPAFEVAAGHFIADYDDEAALAGLAEQCDVITLEFENIPVETVQWLGARTPVLPGTKSLEVAQDRVSEKDFANDLGIATAPWRQVDTAADLDAALGELGGAAILKTRRLGYDGKGQLRLGPDVDAGAAMAELGGAPAVLEGLVPFEREISVIAARSADGSFAAFDPPENVHRDGILHTSTVPAAVSPEQAAAAVESVRRLADALGHVGVLAVEFFVTGPEPGDLLVNEIAPRVHNSGHWTIEACAASQFRQHVRAVAGWPLANPVRHADAVMTNMIGAEADKWCEIAADPGAVLHLYGKTEPRPDRKMGHVTRISTISIS